MAKLSNVHLSLIPDGKEHHIAKVRFNIAFEDQELTLGTRFRALVPLFGQDPLVDEHLQTELGEFFNASREFDNPRAMEVSFRVANTTLDEDIIGDDEVYAAVELYADRSTGLEMVDRQKSQVVVGNF